MSRAGLDVFFAPRGVAVIGASRDEDKLGHAVFRNLAQARPRAARPRAAVYPVNPNADTVLGHRCYTDIADVPDPIDLAAVILPAPYVPDVVEACGRRGLRGVIVLSGGFREMGADGAAREAELVEIVRRYNMRLLGPNCVGIIDNVSGLNTSFIAGRPPRGDIAFLSQSGAIGGAVVDWALEEKVGFSRFISLGNQADVTEADVITYLGDDPDTRVIALYLESIRDGRAFMRVASNVARRKPIVALKVGRTDAGARAAVSHTGALTGTDDVYSAAFRQCGVLRVQMIDALFDAARTFQAYPDMAAALRQAQGRDRAGGPRTGAPRTGAPRTGAPSTGARSGLAVAIVSNAGGPAVLAADALAGQGAALELANFETQTQARLREAVPPSAQVGNPIDMLGGADAALYGAVVRATLADPGVNAVIAIHVPQALVSPTDVAEAIARAAGASDQLGTTGEARPRLGSEPGAGRSPPILASFMGGAMVAAARDLLRQHGIPEYATPERAAQAAGWLAWRQSWRREGERESTPLVGPGSGESGPSTGSGQASGVSLDEDDRGVAVRRSLATLQAARMADGPSRSAARGRTTLTGPPAFDILRAYDIPAVDTRVAATAPGAVAAAEAIGYPVALKAVAPELVHKTDVGGVMLNLGDAAAVAEAFERLMRDVPARSGTTPDEVLVQAMAPTSGASRWEVLCGFVRDQQFGPVVVYGLGGIYVEALADVAYRVAPLSAWDAWEMIEETRSARLLRGVRGQAPADVDAIVACLQNVGALAMDQPAIAELDINPLVVWSAGAVAVDVRIELDSTLR